MVKKVNIGWEDVILKVFKKNEGIISLKELYQEVPRYIDKSKSEDLEHTIRAYLRRLKSQKKLIKQIGLSTYSLSDIEYKGIFYENITKKTNPLDSKKNIPRENVHGYIEGMLVELGNFNNFETYSADQHIVFNGKSLSNLCTIKNIPKFTYDEILEKVRLIDVVWFQDGFPVKTFDVENSTDFSKALIRAYQLKSFKTKFYMVAEDSKKKIYDNRINTKPFDTIKSDVEFILYDSIFELYKQAAVFNQKSKGTFLET